MTPAPFPRACPPELLISSPQKFVFGASRLDVSRLHQIVADVGEL